MIENHENPGNAPFAPERRACERVQLRSVAYLELDRHNGGVILNLSEGGIAVQAAELIAGSDFPKMRFRLPHSEKWLEVSGKLAWIGDTRKEAGIQFISLNDDVRKQIRRWSVSASLSEGAPDAEAVETISAANESVPAVKNSPDDIPSELEAMFPSEKELASKPAPATRAGSAEGAGSGPAKVARPPQKSGPSDPLYTYDLPISAPVRRTAPNPVPNEQFVYSAPSSGHGTRAETRAQVAVAPALVAAVPAPEPPTQQFVEPDQVERQQAERKPDPGDPASTAALEGRALPGKSTGAHFGAADASAIRAAWLPRRAAGGELEPSQSQHLGIPFSGLGYQPTDFEEPTGKGWLVVTIVLLLILMVGIVMAVGPATLKHIVMQRVSSVSSETSDMPAVAGPPPPVEASAPAAPRSPIARDSRPAASRHDGVPVPVTKSSDDAPDAVVSSTPPKDLNSETSSLSAQNRQEGPREIETPQETAAKVRQFQLEHSGGVSSTPLSNSDSAIVPQQPVAATPTPVEPSVTTVSRGDRPSEPHPGAASPAAIPASPAIAGTVAISSHFQSVRGEESQTPSGSVHVGQLSSFRQPPYPVEAVRAHVEGTVALRVIVDPTGAVESVRLVSGPPMLVFAAINSVWQWRYNRTTLNGRPVESIEDVTVAFHLGNSAPSPR
jgi:outer membrane biosynthesis protein TonB